MNQQDLSTFGRNILVHYIEWDRYGEKLNFIPVTKEFLKDTLEYLPDAVIRRIASKAGRNALVDLTLIAQGTLTAETFANVLNDWLKASRVTFRYEKKDGYHYAISHSLGRKWSVYLESLVEAMCEELPTKVHCRVERRDGSIAIHLTQTTPPTAR